MTNPPEWVAWQDNGQDPQNDEIWWVPSDWQTWWHLWKPKVHHHTSSGQIGMRYLTLPYSNDQAWLGTGHFVPFLLTFKLEDIKWACVILRLGVAGSSCPCLPLTRFFVCGGEHSRGRSSALQCGRGHQNLNMRLSRTRRVLHGHMDSESPDRSHVVYDVWSLASLILSAVPISRLLSTGVLWLWHSHDTSLRKSVEPQASTRIPHLFHQ